MARIRLAARTDSLDRVKHFVRDLSGTADLPGDRQYKLRLAAEEIATNIIIHGYGAAGRSAGASACLVLEGALDDERVWIRFTDDGPRFDPTQHVARIDVDEPLKDRQIGGLGIHLARSSLDEFHYERRGGQNLTTLVLHRGPAAELATGPGAPPVTAP